MKTIYFDAHENTVRATVNRFGKKVKFDNGGYRIGLLCDGIEAVYFNTQCPDQFAAECYGLLKAVEFAKEQGFTSALMRNDRVTSFVATTKRGYKGSTYLWLAEKMAKEAGIEVAFEYIASEQNPADEISRREGADQGIQVAKPKPSPTSATEAATQKPVWVEITLDMSRTQAEKNLNRKYGAYNPALWTEQEQAILSAIKARRVVATV